MRDFISCRMRGVTRIDQESKALGVSFDPVDGGKPVRVLLSVDSAIELQSMLDSVFGTYYRECRTNSQSASSSGSPSLEVSIPRPADMDKQKPLGVHPSVAMRIARRMDELFKRPGRRDEKPIPLSDTLYAVCPNESEGVDLSVINGETGCTVELSRDESLHLVEIVIQQLRSAS
jgi:hypothetical protein